MMKPRCAPSVESGEEYGMGNEKKLCQLSLYRVTMQCSAILLLRKYFIFDNLGVGDHRSEFSIMIFIVYS